MAAKRIILAMGLVIGGVSIAGYWWLAVAAFQAGQVFVYTNYWNAPIGTLTLAIVLAMCTVGWFWAVWHFFKPKGKKSTGD